MDTNVFGLMEIYDCVFKPTYDMKVGKRLVQAGEPLLVFDSLQMADFHELKNRTSAKGGYNNQTWITWESPKELDLTFTQGVFSQTHLAMLGNSFIKQAEAVAVPKIEKLEIDDNLQVQLRYKPDGDIFIYNRQSGKKYTQLDMKENVITIADAQVYDEAIIHYSFIYNDANSISIGRQLCTGFLDVTAKTRLKDDITGKLVTGIFHMPKVKLVSDFSIRLGNNVPPAVGNFKVAAFPTGSKGSEKVMEFISLNDDIDSDF